MFKRKSSQEQLEDRIKKFEKETFERGLVEHLPPAGSSLDRLRYVKDLQADEADQ